MMMNYKSFRKDMLLQELSSKGFKSIDDDAFVRIVLTIEVMVYNMLNNLQQISKTKDIETIKKEHFSTLISVMKNTLKSKQGSNKKAKITSSLQNGGAHTVLPSEYFGFESNRYFDIDQLVNEQTAISADSVVARPAITYQHGGKKRCFLEISQLKNIIDAYKTAKKRDFKITKGALDVMMTCIQTNLKKLYQAIQDNATPTINIDLQLLVVVLTKYFPHLKYKYKK